MKAQRENVFKQWADEEKTSVKILESIKGGRLFQEEQSTIAKRLCWLIAVQARDIDKLIANSVS